LPHYERAGRGTLSLPILISFTMTPERWQQIEALYHEALERAPEQRPAFLEEACAGDQTVRREVESLLAYDECAADFIASPLDDLAAELLADEQTALFIGRDLNHYRILSRLGRGGMGEVYLATDTRLGRDVAIKLLPTQFAADGERVRRLKQEARAASSLNHPNILTIHEIGEVDGLPFIVSEFVEGQTLRDRMAGGKMDVLAVLDRALQVASALEAAHNAGIVHRDIKPENVMARSDGLVKVLDFGLAKLAERPARTKEGGVASRGPTAAHLSTEPGVLLGTVSYMSPEQLRGQKVDQRTDLFSLGVMLYEMIAGRAPFPGAAPADAIAAILEREPAPLRQTAPDLPEALEWIVTKALRKDRDERYQTARELLTDLKALRRRLEIEKEHERSRPELPTSGTTLETDDQKQAIDSAGGTTGRTDPASELTTTSGGTHQRPGGRRFALAGIGLAILASVVGGAYWLFGTGRVIDSVAVLPFVNEGGDPNTEYLSDGITESLIRSLSQLPDLKVIARASVLRYKGREIDPKAVCAELGVRAVLTGRVVQRDGLFVVTVELADASNNSHIWGERYDRTDLSAIQDIVKDIAERLRLRLTNEEERLLAQRQLANAEAYRLYLIGRYHWDKRTEEGVNTAIKHFQQAIDLEPGYALAYTGLADSYSSLGFSFDVGSLSPDEAMPKATEAAMKALQLDNTLAEAHTSLAFIKLNYEWDAAGAEREFKRAIDLDPSYATAHHWYSHVLTALGRVEESLTESKRALVHDPLGLIINVHLGWHYIQAHKYDQALHQLHKTLELDPNYGTTHWYLGLAYEQKGDYDRAATELRRALEILKGNTVVEADLAHVYAVADKKTDALRILEKLTQQSREQYVSPYLIAMIHAALGDKDSAFEWLDKAYDQRSDSLVYLKVEPKLEPLRDDPRFTRLLQRVRLAP
jgi:serine/threonine protein kinase/TolB-like protein/Tfp pilus assembly protein PilF